MLKHNKLLKNTLLLFFVLGLLFGGLDALAQNLNVDYPEIRLPGGVFNINKALQIGKLTIKQLVILIYGAIVLFAGVAAFFLLIYAGLAYIISGGNPGMRKRAFQRFKNVWAGIGIILVSYFVLYIINPSIVNLDKSLVLQAISPENDQFLGFSFQKAELEDVGTFSCEWADEACVPKEENTCIDGYLPSCGGITSDIDEASTKCNEVLNARCQTGSNTNGGGDVGTIGKSCFDNSDCSLGERCSFSDPSDPTSGSCVSTGACPVSKVTSSNTSYCYDRGDERHNGHDIMAEKLTPIYAMEAGTIDVSFSSFSGCKLWIKSTVSGRGYAHLHLGTTLNCSNAYATGIKDGVKVTSGQHIAYVGTTYNGKADGTVPHLHLTIVKPGGTEECSPPPLSGSYGGPSMDGAPLFQQANCPFT